MSQLPSGRAVVLAAVVGLVWWPLNALWPPVAAVLVIAGFLAVAAVSVLDQRSARRRAAERALARRTAQLEADRSMR